MKKKYVSQAGRKAVKLIFGNTASGVYQNEHPKYLIDISAIDELGKIEETDSGLYVGAAVTIQEADGFHFRSNKKAILTDQTTGLKEFKRHADYIAGLQVRSLQEASPAIFS